jgi:hypothetical protein
VAKGKRKRRRPGAGPQPTRNPRRDAAGTADAPAAAGAPRRPRRAPGEPVPPSFRGVVVRALIVAALFYPYLVYVAGEEPGVAALISLIAFALMIPFGLLLDRMRYRLQMRRHARAQAARAGR